MWTDHEVGVALGRNVLVVPVKMTVDPYGLIGKYQAVPSAGRTPHALAADIADTLGTHERSRQLMAEVAVDRFRFSYSWNNARATLNLIRQIPDALWTPAMISAVRKAVSENGELQADVGFGRSNVAAEALALVNAL
jgi:hypothetical protein